MEKIKVIVVDDEKFARQSIVGILTENFLNVEILCECENVPQAVKAINTHKPQIVFLDIEMPQQNGFSLFDYFEQEDLIFKVVFVTAFNEYALKAIQLSALDYILKPPKVEDIKRALTKSENFFTSQKTISNLKNNLSSTIDKKIILQTADHIYTVQLKNIVFFKADGNYTQIHTTTHGVLLITKKLSEFEYLENEDFFFRSHRSFLINLQEISKIDKKDFVVFMSNGEQAGLAQEKKNILLNKINQ